MPDSVSYLTSPFVLRAAAAFFFVAINAALSGVFANFRNSTFLVSGASHAALGGAALVIVLESRGSAFGISPVFGAAVFAVLLALAAGSAYNRGSTAGSDTAIGVGFALSMALAVLLISLIPESASRVWGLLMGDVLLITNQDLVLLAFLTLCLAIVFVVFWKQFLFVSFDLDGARAFGINADRFNYLLFALIGLSSALLVKAIGSILVFAMLSAPAATALLISDSVKKTLWWSFAIAFVAGILALVLSYFTALSVSAIAAFLVTTAYFAVRIWRFASAQ